MTRVRGAVRAGVCGVLVVFLAAACTSGSGPAKTPSSSVSHTPTALATSGNLSAQCRALVQVASRVSKAQTDLYASGSTSAIGDLQAALRSLDDGVPANVKAALGELADGFGTAQQLLAKPTDKNKAELAKLQSKLAADAQAVSTYVVSKCPA